MSSSTDLINDIKRKMLAKYPRFGSEIAKLNIEFKDDLPFHTAATDGQNIYVDSNYFESLNESDRLFLIAHEVMHIKFMHMFRLTDKDGKRRNLELWNIATDAIINANLERDGFKIKEGYVNMPEAIQYSAEEFYQKLLEEQEKKKQEQNDDEQKQSGDSQKQSSDSQNQSGDSQKQSSDSQNQSSDGQNEDKNGQISKQCGDHSLWEEAFQNREQNKNQNGKKQETQIDSKEEQELEKNKKWNLMKKMNLKEIEKKKGRSLKQDVKKQSKT